MAASTFTISGDGYLFTNETETITITQDNPSNFHIVTFEFGSKTWELRHAGGTALFRPNDAATDAEWSLIIPSNVPYIRGRVIVHTYNSGGFYIGSTWKEQEIHVALSQAPSIGTLTITDQVTAISTLLGSKRFIQNQSSIQMSVSGANPPLGTTIDYYNIACDGRWNKGAWNFGKPTIAKTYTVEWAVYDKRGRSSRGSTTFAVLPYEAPRITNFVVNRANTTAALVMSGTVSSLTNASNAQKQTYKIQVKRRLINGFFDTVYDGVATTGTSFSIAPQDPLDPAVSYQYEMSLTDAVGLVTTSLYTIGTDRAVMHLDEIGLGVGKYREKGTLDVEGNAYFDRVILENGGDVFKIKSGILRSDAYQEFYTNPQDQNERTGYFGYTNSNNNHFVVVNEKQNGIVQFNSSLVQARDKDGAYFVPMLASAFTVNSQREMKHGIEEFTVSEMGNTALEEVCNTPVYKYHYHSDLENEIKRTGIIIDTAPLDIVSLDGIGIDTYQMLSLAYQAIKELSGKVTELESRIVTLEGGTE